MNPQETAIFAAGCFWGIEDTFRKLPGVLQTITGYTGGTVKNPTYEQVCTGTTGHAEAVEIVFNPNVVSYTELLSVFWRIHDPTTLNKQGPDEGTQYRSVIFFTNDDQKIASIDSLRDAQKKYNRKIVTEIIPATEFYRAEEYHQKYFMKKGGGTCH